MKAALFPRLSARAAGAQLLAELCWVVARGPQVCGGLC
jgi:hypothetical protein